MEPGLPQRHLRRRPRRSARASLGDPHHCRRQLPPQGSSGARGTARLTAHGRQENTPRQLKAMQPNDLPIVCLPVELSDEAAARSEEHTSELQSLAYLVCRLLLEKKKT